MVWKFTCDVVGIKSETVKVSGVPETEQSQNRRFRPIEVMILRCQIGITKKSVIWADKVQPFVFLVNFGIFVTGAAN